MNKPRAQFPPLRILFWESTANCNLNCIHCRRVPTGDDELSTAQFRTVLNSAAALGEPLIIFSGGEPLLRDDWEELSAFARSLGLPTALATNGTMIDTDMAGRIAATQFHRVAVSLDGADPETHDSFRGLAGAFDRAMAGVSALRSEGVPVQINATIAAHNFDQLDRVYQLARGLDAAALHLFLLVPVGCGMHIAQTHQLTPQQYEQVLNWVCDRQQEAGLQIRATCAPHYNRIAEQRGVLAASEHYRGCLAGRGVVFVSATGEVYPCGYLPVTCGSVRQGDLADIWRSSQILAELRDADRLGGKCGRCEYKGICGGCRARAYAACGDYLSEEPTCTYRPSAAT